VPLALWGVYFVATEDWTRAEAAEGGKRRQNPESAGFAFLGLKFYTGQSLAKPMRSRTFRLRKLKPFSSVYNGVGKSTSTDFSAVEAER